MDHCRRLAPGRREVCRAGIRLPRKQGRARAANDFDGMVKILAHKETDAILGGHIVGPRASDLLGEIVMTMEFGGSAEDLARGFHSHPTFTEAVREAALAVDKRARQI